MAWWQLFTKCLNRVERSTQAGSPHKSRWIAKQWGPAWGTCCAPRVVRSATGARARPKACGSTGPRPCAQRLPPASARESVCVSAPPPLSLRGLMRTHPMISEGLVFGSFEASGIDCGCALSACAFCAEGTNAVALHFLVVLLSQRWIERLQRPAQQLQPTQAVLSVLFATFWLTEEY